MIRIEGLEALIRKVHRLEELKGVVNAIRAGALHLKGKVAVAASGNSHRPQPFKNDKQRKYFFAALRARWIEVPYRRGMSPQSEKLEQSWTIAEKNSGLTAIVGTDASYAKLVQQKTTQTAYHKQTGWVVTKDVVEQEGPLVVKLVQDEIEREMRE